MKPPRLYGLVAEFIAPEPLLAAAQHAREAGYRRMDAYTPFPVEGLAETLGMRFTGVPLLTLLAGTLGGSGAYFMQWYSATIHYPLNVGGRPLHSWPAFVPVTFELTVLCASLTAAFGMLFLNGLPRPHHPIFNTPHYEERNASRFYLCVEARDAKFREEEVRRFLEEQKPEYIWEVLE
jgi:hypothetical protein